MQRTLLGLLIIIMLLVSCGHIISDPGVPSESSDAIGESPQPETEVVETSNESSTEPATAPVEPPLDPIAEKIAQMSLREKVGLLFIIRPDGLDLELTREELENPNRPGILRLSESEKAVLHDYPVGGFCFFEKNLESPDQLQDLMQELTSALPWDPIFAIDEEGGSIARLANHPGFSLPQFPDMQVIGARGDPEEAKALGLAIGQYLKQLGFQLNFAPVADVNSNPNNPIIGVRAFSDQPEIVASMVQAAVEGFHSAGMMCAIKHFPGHGDTQTDSHLESVQTMKSWEDLQALELIPFQAGIAAGADMVMLGHILTPEVHAEGLPATLSPDIHQRLRQLGFDGLMITDALAMQAISDEFDPAQAARLAFAAGNHILLMPAHLPQAFDAIFQAVESENIKMAELDARIRPILELKANYALE